MEQLQPAELSLVELQLLQPEEGTVHVTAQPLQPAAHFFWEPLQLRWAERLAQLHCRGQGNVCPLIECPE